MGPTGQGQKAATAQGPGLLRVQAGSATGTQVSSLFWSRSLGSTQGNSDQNQAVAQAQCKSPVQVEGKGRLWPGSSLSNFGAQAMAHILIHFSQLVLPLKLTAPSCAWSDPLDSVFPLRSCPYPWGRSVPVLGFRCTVWWASAVQGILRHPLWHLLRTELGDLCLELKGSDPGLATPKEVGAPRTATSHPQLTQCDGVSLWTNSLRVGFSVEVAAWGQACSHACRGPQHELDARGGAQVAAVHVHSLNLGLSHPDGLQGSGALWSFARQTRRCG